MSQKEVTIISEANSLQTVCSNCGRACPLTRLQNEKYAMICQACFDKLPTDQRHDGSMTEFVCSPVASDGRITPEQVRVVAGERYRYGRHAISLFLRMVAKQMEQDAKKSEELKQALEHLHTAWLESLQGHEQLYNAVYHEFRRSGDSNLDQEVMAALAAASTQKPNEPCDLECGDRFFKGVARCRHGRTPDEIC